MPPAASQLGGGGCSCPDGCPPCTASFINPGSKNRIITVARTTTDCCHGITQVLVDLSGKGFELTDAADGVRFDIMGTGELVQMGWPSMHFVSNS